MSRIVTVEVFEQSIPFADGGGGENMVPGQRWERFDTVLVRLEAADGQHGWGEAFSYGCQAAVSAALRDMVVPLVLDQDSSDPARLTEAIQRKLHLFGRYGITTFAISGVDTALWDMKARREGVALATLLGTPRRQAVEAYASLVRYADPVMVKSVSTAALATGFRAIKLHEVDPAVIEAARDAVGPSTLLTVDANCAWTPDQFRMLASRLAAVSPAWIEEPIFPPEDFPAMAMLGRETGLPLAAGENNCTRHQFEAMALAGAVTFPQPSVTKIGGVTEFAATLALSERLGQTCMPHSPYFGPGYLATLQLLAVTPGDPLLEVLHVEPSGFAGVATPLPVAGLVSIPEAPGIGFSPNENAFSRFTTNRWSRAT